MTSSFSSAGSGGIVSVNHMNEQEITPEYVQILLAGITPGEWAHVYNKNYQFIAAAPAIAEAYLELAEEFSGYRAKTCADRVSNNYEQTRFSREEMEALQAFVIADQEELELMRKETTRLRSIIEQQREVLKALEAAAAPQGGDNE